MYKHTLLRAVPPPSPPRRYACVALAGVLSEYLSYGRAEGGLGDVQSLDALMRALQVSTVLDLH